MTTLPPHCTDEQTGITYTLSADGNYYIPDLILPPQEEYDIGRYGRMRHYYLRKHRKGLFSVMLTQGTLNQHLHEVDVRAWEQVDAIVQHFAKQNGTDEALKARDPMRWVGLMNNYRHCDEEIVLREVVWE